MSLPAEPYDFREQLEMSHKASDLPLWRELYEQAFPGMKAMVDHREDGWHQRAGVDRSITLNDSKVVRIDEKVRGKNRRTGKVYEDIALEFLSNDRTNAPGWVCKKLLADYIAYAIAPLGKAYLLPVQQLQAAWRYYGESWKKACEVRKAANRGYNTLFCPVPPGILLAAISSQLIFSVTPVEWVEG